MPVEQPSVPQVPPQTESRFEGLLPTAGPPPALGPTPTAEVQKEYAQFADGRISPQETIEVVVGRAVIKVLWEKPRRIYVPSEDFVTCQVVTDRQIAIVGKRTGRDQCRFLVSRSAESQRSEQGPCAELHGRRAPRHRCSGTPAVARQEATGGGVGRLQERAQSTRRANQGSVPDSAVQLSLVGEQVVVRGEAKDVVEAAQILAIIAEHAPVSNRRRGVSTRGAGAGNVNLNLSLGSTYQQAALNGLENALQGAGSPGNLSLTAGPGQEQAAINAIQQILAGTRTSSTCCEFRASSRSCSWSPWPRLTARPRTIGMDFSITQGAMAFAQNIGQGLNVGTAAAGTVTGATGISPAAQALRDVGGNLPTSIDNGNVLMAIQALRTLNFARSLAEPNLTTLNGKPANFQAGGSFPIPNSIVLPGGTAQSVTYQNFGVALQFTPFITDRNRIRLVLNASVSTPSTATTQVSGAAVPSQITQRQFQTTVELREGQTLTVAGLIQNNFSGQSNRVPFWGDLPIIGRTGGIDSISSGEQELVVLVTPVLVHPLDMCQTPSLPGNNIFEPGDVEFYLGGQLESRRTYDYRASVRTDFAKQTRYCDGNDIFIIGPHGTTYGCCNLGCPCGQPTPRPAPDPGPPASAPMPPAEPVPTPGPQ